MKESKLIFFCKSEEAGNDASDYPWKLKQSEKSRIAGTLVVLISYSPHLDEQFDFPTWDSLVGAQLQAALLDDVRIQRVSPAHRSQITMFSEMAGKTSELSA